MTDERTLEAQLWAYKTSAPTLDQSNKKNLGSPPKFKLFT